MNTSTLREEFPDDSWFGEPLGRKISFRRLETWLKGEYASKYGVVTSKTSYRKFQKFAAAYEGVVVQSAICSLVVWFLLVVVVVSRRRTGERRRSLAVSSRSVVISGRACVRSVRDRGRCETPVLSQIPSASRAFRALALGQPDPPGRGGIWAWARIFTHRTRDRTSLSPWARAHPWLFTLQAGSGPGWG